MVVAVVVAGLAMAGGAQDAPCQPDRLLPTAVPGDPVVLMGWLEKVEDGDADRLPTIGTSDVVRLIVKVRVRRIVRGDFPVQAGDEFLLGIHSVALTFGYDHVGESYYLGLEPNAEASSNLSLTSVAIPPETLFFVRARLSEATSSEPAGLPRVDLVSKPSEFVTAVFEPGMLPPELTPGSRLTLGVPSVDPPIQTSARICLGLIGREAKGVRSLRLVRLIGEGGR